MRILMLAQFYAPIVGGEERHVQDLATNLAARGHSVAVATQWQAGLPEFAVEGGVRIHRLRGLAQQVPQFFKESGRRHAPPFPDPGLVWSLRRVIALERPEIVHAHNWLVHSFLPLKTWSEARLVMSLHDYSLVCAVKTLMYRGRVCSGTMPECLLHAGDHYGVAKGIPIALANWAMGPIERRLVDNFIVVSQAVAVGNHLVGEHTPYTVIPNILPSVEAAAAGTWDEYLTQLPPEPFLLFVGDLRPEKGTEVLLRAYADLVGQRGSSVPPLVLIGRILPQTPRELPPNAYALNSWPPGAVWAARERSLMALMPSTWAEPFGIAALEGLAIGRPVIASAIGGLTDIVVHEENGLLVPPGDAGALRGAIERLLDSPAQVEQMGEAARRRAQLFTAANVVPRVERVYEGLLAKRAGRWA